MTSSTPRRLVGFFEDGDTVTRHLSDDSPFPAPGAGFLLGDGEEEVDEQLGLVHAGVHVERF